MKRHIRSPHDLSKSWCGVYLAPRAYCFSRIDSAVCNTKFKKINEICNSCAKEINILLSQKELNNET